MIKKTPTPIQLSDLAFLISERYAGLLHDPGGGKTMPACLLMYYASIKNDLRSYFIMPKSLLRKNYIELLECTNFTKDDIVIVDGTPAQREKQLNSGAKVFLMGFKRFADDWETLNNIYPNMGCIVIDEYHMGFKNINSKRSIELVRCARRKINKFFVPLSGTLISGRLDSCYSAIHIIEPRYYANLKAFHYQHALLDENGTIVGWRNFEKIGRILKRHFRRLSFSEIHGDHDTNKPIIQKEYCELTPAQQTAYDTVKEEAILELKDMFLDIPTGGVQVMRCRQIMGHPHTFGLTSEEDLTGKEESLLVHLTDHLNSGKPLIIFASLIPEQERLHKLCLSTGLRSGLINANTSSQQRDDIDTKFRAGNLDVVVASPATTAVGYNWGHVDHIIFASLDYENVNFVQAYRRAIRGGVRSTKLLITLLQYYDSIDHDILGIIDYKSRILHKTDPSYEELFLSKI